MLERIRRGRVVRGGAWDSRGLLRRRLVPRRPRVLRPRLRGAGRGRGSRGPRRRHARDRDARGRGVPRLRAPSTGSPRAPVHWHGHDDFGLGDGGRDRRRAGGRDLGAGHGQRHGGAGGERRPRRGRARARGALRHPHTARPHAGTRALAARRGTGRHAAPAVEGGHGRGRSSPGSRAPSRPSSTTPLRSSRTRRTSSAPNAASCSARRAASTRSGSALERLGLDVPAERHAALLAGVKRLGTDKTAVSSPTTSCAALVAENGGSDGPWLPEPAGAPSRAGLQPCRDRGGDARRPLRWATRPEARLLARRRRPPRPDGRRRARATWRWR